MAEIGIGRRTFLRAFGAALLALPQGPSPSVLFSGPYYINRGVGLGFKIPPNWSVLTAADLGEIDCLAMFSSEFRAQIAEYVDNSQKPIVALKSDLNPDCTIEIYLTARQTEPHPLDEMFNNLRFFKNGGARPKKSFSPLMLKIREDWQFNRIARDNYRVSGLPTDFLISNCPATEYTATFDFLPPALSSAKRMRCRTVYVIHHEVAYWIRLLDTADCLESFDPFLETVRLI
ncbi:MAG: hypothetical protein ACK493_03155 [Planctomycetota bacterium]|jgi:hypothetical protein|nr:hypothetical protein [Blastopirellula sp.]